MNNIIVKELLTNAKPFLSTDNVEAVKAFDYINNNIFPEKIIKHISPRFFNSKTAPSKINSKYILDNTSVIFIVDGVYDSINSVLPNGLSIDSKLSTSEPFKDNFLALNALTSISPIHLTFKAGSVLTAPLTIVHTVTDKGVNKIISPRIEVTVGENAELTIFEVFTSTQNDLFQYTTNANINFNLGENSKVEHIQITDEAKNSLHIGWTQSKLNRNARYTSIIIHKGQLANYSNLNIDLNTDGAETAANSIFNLKGTNTNTIHTSINHNSSHTHSTQLCKGVLNDESFGIFNGNIFVKQDSQEITSSQLNKNLLLSKKAHIDTRPQLLVSADDVKCSHGATIGYLSEEEAFYLESRGIKKERAKEMLTEGFSKEVILLIKNKTVREFCEQRLYST